MKAVGIILAGGSSNKMSGLAISRATSAMPVAGSYKAVDFALSNMSHSGMTKVIVITQFNSKSLHEHLSSSKWWDLGRKQGGLFVCTPYLSGDNPDWFRGTADSIYQNIGYLDNANEEYVVISSGDIVYKADFKSIIKQHAKSGADITVLSQDKVGQDVSSYGVMEIDENNRIIEFEEKPLEPSSTRVSLGVYVMSRTLLIKLLETIISQGRYDFVHDIIFRYRRKLNIMSLDYPGYWSRVNNLMSYYNTNLDFINKDVRDLFTRQYPYINTKPSDEPPAKYNATAHTRNCIAASGSILNGVVENSVLFRKVFTGENSVIKNSIVMEGCYIGNNCVVENAIFDRGVVLSDGKQVIGDPANPKVVIKGTVL